MSFYVEAEAAEKKFLNLEAEAEAIEKKFPIFEVEAEAMKNFAIKWKRKQKLLKKNFLFLKWKRKL